MLHPIILFTLLHPYSKIFHFWAFAYATFPAYMPFLLSPLPIGTYSTYWFGQKVHSCFFGKTLPVLRKNLNKHFWPTQYISKPRSNALFFMKLFLAPSHLLLVGIYSLLQSHTALSLRHLTLRVVYTS